MRRRFKTSNKVCSELTYCTRYCTVPVPYRTVRTYNAAHLTDLPTEPRGAMLVQLLCFLPAVAALRLHVPRRASVPMMKVEASAVCAALEAGQTPEGLAELVATPRKARAFFEEYFNGADYKCADAETPPVALTDAIWDAEPALCEAILMNVMTNSANGLAAKRSGDDGKVETCERAVSRAVTLVNAIHDRNSGMRMSLQALKDALLSEEIFIEDASDGNMELLRSTWKGLISFCDYDKEQISYVRVDMDRCGGEKGTSISELEAFEQDEIAGSGNLHAKSK